MDKKVLEIYEQELENQPQAPESVIEAYRGISEAIDAYIEELEKYYFAWGYEVGREGRSYE